MHVGSLLVRLIVRESRSLKDKRQVVRSIVDRLRNGFNVSVAEVGAREHHQQVILGVAAVGEEAASVKAVLDQIADALRKHPIAEFCSCELSVDQCHE
jgi:uncharacterized protein YlxP (DUF503 family)